MVAEALVGVEVVAWLRAWAGMSMEAKEGLLDNSEREHNEICLFSTPVLQIHTISIMKCKNDIKGWHHKTTYRERQNNTLTSKYNNNKKTLM